MKLIQKIMSFFKNLFGKKQNQDLPEIPETLFIDNEDPSGVKKQEREKSPLAIFLDRDYYQLGYREGYDNQTSDYQNSRIREIKSSYHQMIDILIDDLDAQCLKLELQLNRTGSLSPQIHFELSKVIEFNRKKVIRLEKEKALAVEDEGSIMKAIHRFKLGYQKGCREFLEEENYLAETQLFTQIKVQ